MNQAYLDRLGGQAGTTRGGRHGHYLSGYLADSWLEPVDMSRMPALFLASTAAVHHRLRLFILGLGPLLEMTGRRLEVRRCPRRRRAESQAAVRWPDLSWSPAPRPGSAGRCPARRRRGRRMSPPISTSPREPVRRWHGGRAPAQRGGPLRAQPGGAETCLAAALGVSRRPRRLGQQRAGIEILGTVAETAPEIWDEVMAVNLRGTYLMSRAALPAAAGSAERTGEARDRQQRLADGPCLQRPAGRLLRSKAGVVSLTRSMALDHAGRHLRVNCVCPASSTRRCWSGASR